MTCKNIEMTALYNDLRKCMELNQQLAGRVIVQGAGAVNADILLVGEAPGREEEQLGAPFVGKAGENLNSFLETLNISRDEIYITNVVKIRPFAISEKTGNQINRPPNSAETAFFAPFLYKEISLVAPKMVVTLGNVALRTVSENKRARIGDMHGRSFDYDAYRLFPLYHPASIIYNRQLVETYNKDIASLAVLLRM